MPFGQAFMIMIITKSPALQADIPFRSKCGVQDFKENQAVMLTVEEGVYLVWNVL
jgi:hypothetical protein